MNLYSLLTKRSPNKVFVALVVGILAGMAYSLLVPLLLGSFEAQDGMDREGGDVTRLFGLEVTNPGAALVFGVAVLFMWGARTWVEITMMGVSMSATHDLRVQMYYRVAHAPLAAIERIGLSRIVTSLSVDMPSIVTGAQVGQGIAIDLVTLVAMLGFLAYLNADVFWFVLAGIGICVLTYQVIFHFADRYYQRVAKINDELQKAFHGMMLGFKELKLSDEKRSQYFDQVLLAAERGMLAAHRPAILLYSAASNFGMLVNFLLLGSVAFIFVSYHALSAQELTNIVMMMMYLSVPIFSVTSKIAMLTQARVAMKRVNELLEALPEEAVQPGPPKLEKTDAWRSVRFEKVTYEHEDVAGNRAFTVGPIDLEFRKGAISFVVGGNGSGKSTLSKLLTLHYHRSAGTIWFGDDRVTHENMNAYRQSIYAIYSDYHLFDRILTPNRDQAEVEHYLRKLGLDRKVSYRDGKFSTLSLSDGQRRRMALVVAFLEDKELYLFDEWAADQDPEFKEVFYREILPSLRARGKAVVVISHDNRYFDAADYLVVMCEGQVQSVQEGLALREQRIEVQQ
jgi:putative pyoverdin transport system ATP-binding/permease protein